MLYAPLGKEQWPLGFEEVEYLQKELRNYATPASSIQVVLEKGMFHDADNDRRHECFKFVIIEWANRRNAFSDRNVLGEYTDVKEVTGMLRLLLGMAKDAHAARSALVGKSVYEMYQDAMKSRS
jgi:hypothetical protein